MARQNLRRYADRDKVTRTISVTSADVLYFDKESGKNQTAHVTINGTLTPEQVFKRAKVPGIKLQVDNVLITSGLYGMPIETFLMHAEKLGEDQEEK